MRIVSLSLTSFRLYRDLTLSFGDNPANVFVGNNGSGKTNIIEAIALLSQGRSCLRADFLDMLRHDETFFRLRADTVSDSGEESSVECVFQISPKRATAFSIRDVRTPLLSFIGSLPSITFLPQDLDLFTGSPSGRRGYIDALLCQLMPDYARVRLQYERVLKQRNALLRRIGRGEASDTDLDVWDDELANAGTQIREKRALVLGQMESLLTHELQQLGETFSSLRIEYVAGTEDLAVAVRAARSKDIMIQTTSCGPHRDDWRILTDGYPIGTSLSRGQQRTVFLALLFVSAQLFGSIRKEKPVILLDDVLSELDAHHQELLLKRLHDHQVFVTTTHPVDQLTGLRTWEVREGVVKGE